MDEITFQVMPDMDAQAAAFKTGDLDAVFGGEPSGFPKACYIQPSDHHGAHHCQAHRRAAVAGVDAFQEVAEEEVAHELLVLLGAVGYCFHESLPQGEYLPFRLLQQSAALPQQRRPGVVDGLEGLEPGHPLL